MSPRKLWTLREYIWLACVGIVLGQVGQPDDGDAVPDDRLAGLGHLAVAAQLGGEVDDDRAGPHAPHGSRVTGSARPGPGRARS